MYDQYEKTCGRHHLHALSVALNLTITYVCWVAQ